MTFDHFENGITRDVDSMSRDALAQQVHATAFGVWHQNVARMVDDSAVDLFGHTVVEAAVASFHMVDGYGVALGYDCGKPAVGIAENQELVGFDIADYPLEFGDNACNTLAGACAADTHKFVGSTHAELGEKDVVQAFVEILSSMYKRVVAELVELLDDYRQPDDFGPRA